MILLLESITIQDLPLRRPKGWVSLIFFIPVILFTGKNMLTRSSEFCKFQKKLFLPGK